MEGQESGTCGRASEISDSNDKTATGGLAAGDDEVSHVGTVANDYRKLARVHEMEPVIDQRLYNLAVRHGESDPHYGTGYLIHSVVIEVLARWLTE